MREKFMKKVKKVKSKIKLDKYMPKFNDLAVAALAFIYGMNNVSILILLLATVSRIAKLSILLFLIISNIAIYFILKKFGRVWFK